MVPLWPPERHGALFDIGSTTLSALRRYERTGNPASGLTAEDSAGNGSLMRMAPVPLAYYRDPVTAIELSGRSSTTTHALPVCVDACRYYGALIAGAMQGVSKDELLAPRFSPVPRYWDEHPLEPKIDEVAAGSFTEREPPEIRGGGMSWGRSRPRSGHSTGPRRSRRGASLP